MYYYRFHHRSLYRYQGGVVYVIDVGQSVNTLHPGWEDMLKRDIHNILEFYNKNGVIRDLEEVKGRLYEFVLTEMKERNDKEEEDPVEVEFDNYLKSKLQ